jgi:superfamily I DNA/RNA helicase/mRNA-degrading endonuclease RelE of RelBE toxin-antitoxin system
MDIRVALSADFLKALDALPKSQKNKVHSFVDKFRDDPTSSGINYEKINTFRDQNLRSVRIDQAYRAIVLKPPFGNVYVLLWVDHHDRAYQWAADKVVDVHPETGSLQVYRSEAIDSPKVDSSQDHVPHDDDGLFAEYRDRELIRLGIPEPLLPLVRHLRSEEDLDAVERYMPEEAFEALFMLAAGFEYEQVWREIDDRSASNVDTTDFARALDHPESRRRFVVVDDELELAEILEAPLEQWRVFLHPSQQKLVEMQANGPVRVLGGAGTGKTVVAMHRAKKLAQDMTGNEKLLFTTFTTNLAADIQKHLDSICSSEALSRIEVVNLDRWVSDFLKRNDYPYEIAYWDRAEELWNDALNVAPQDLGLEPGFYRDEWEQVIQAHGIVEWREYIRVPRTGRGQALSRRDRKEVWKVFEEYRSLLSDQGLKEPEDAMRDARSILEHKGNRLPYRSIVVDEAQDLSMEAFKLIRQMIPGGDQPNDLFIVGDAHQRIYGKRVVLGRCGINIVGRSRKLRINYRTTEENRRWATALLHGIDYDDLDGATDSLKGERSLLRGSAPTIKPFSDFGEEASFLARLLGEMDERELRETCVVARTNNLCQQYEGVLRAAGIPTYSLRRSEAEDSSKPGVRLATMHRVKGLEFDRVIIAGANDGIVPHAQAIETDGEITERSLLYVAATRARRETIVTSHGQISRFVEAPVEENPAAE